MKAGAWAGSPARKPEAGAGSQQAYPGRPRAWEEPEDPSVQDRREGARRGPRKRKDEGQAGGWEVLEGEE